MCIRDSLYASPAFFLIAAQSSPRLASALATIGSSKNAAITGASKSSLFNNHANTSAYIILNVKVLDCSITLECSLLDYIQKK